MLFMSSKKRVQLYTVIHIANFFICKNNKITLCNDFHFTWVAACNGFPGLMNGICYIMLSTILRK